MRLETTRKIWIALAVLFSAVGMSAGTPFPTKVYKGTQTAWIQPGGAMKAPKVGKSKDEVTQWEGAHADLSFGVGDFTANASVAKVGNMYAQMLDLHPSEVREYWIRNFTGDARYEELFLHYKEDTPYNLTGQHTDDGADTLIDGQILLKGFTSDSTHSGYALDSSVPWNASVWEGHMNGGALFVYGFEKFSSLYFEVEARASPDVFTLTAQYVSACDDKGNSTDATVTKEFFPVASEWTNLTIIEDSTSGMTSNGTFKFEVPKNWTKCSTSDGSGATYGSGQYFGNTQLKDGYGLWAVRFSLSNSTAVAPDALPVLNNLTIPWYIRYTNPSSPNREFRTIPGWNPANDADGDGWVNETEFASRPHINATARFEFESRALPLGRMWSTKSSWCRTNVFNGNFSGEALAAFYKWDWGQSGRVGAYNDDLLNLVGPAEFLLMSNGSRSSPNLAGHVWEYTSPNRTTLRIDSDSIIRPYAQGFANVLSNVKEITGSQWMMGNTNRMNLFSSANSAAMPFFWALDAVLREDYIVPWMGMTGVTEPGICRLWETFVYAAYGKRSLVQVQIRDGAAGRVHSGTEYNWNTDFYSGTCIYYLINTPQATAYQAWGNGFNYGSGNTIFGEDAPNNYFESGIPMNMAYQKGSILDADIGDPDTNWVPPNPLQYHVKVTGNDYATLIDSTSQSLQHKDITSGMQLSIVPSMIYYAWTPPGSSLNVHTKTPEDTVLARRYSKGLILFRTDLNGHSKSMYLHSDPAMVPLNNSYRQVFIDGSRGPVIQSVNVTMYKGAILELVVDEPNSLSGLEIVGITVLVLVIALVLLVAAAIVYRCCFKTDEKDGGGRRAKGRSKGDPYREGIVPTVPSSKQLALAEGQSSQGSPTPKQHGLIELTENPVGEELVARSRAHSIKTDADGVAAMEKSVNDLTALNENVEATPANSTMRGLRAMRVLNAPENLKDFKAFNASSTETSSNGEKLNSVKERPLVTTIRTESHNKGVSPKHKSSRGSAVNRSTGSEVTTATSSRPTSSGDVHLENPKWNVVGEELIPRIQPKGLLRSDSMAAMNQSNVDLDHVNLDASFKDELDE